MALLVQVYLSARGLCPKSVDRKEETLFEYTVMPKKHGQKRGKQ
jgi:hypothetical protein